MFHHVVISFMPKSFIKQSDFLFPSVYVASIYIYMNLLIDSMPHADFLMFPTRKNSKILVSIKNKSKLSLNL